MAGTPQHPWPITAVLQRLDHNTENSVPYSLRKVCGFLNVPQLFGKKSCETGPPTYTPYPKIPESLTICWCSYKGSTFYSVNPWQLSCCLPIQISSDVLCLLGFLWSFARLHLLALIALFAWTSLLLRAASLLRSLFFNGLMTTHSEYITSNTNVFQSNLRALFLVALQWIL